MVFYAFTLDPSFFIFFLLLSLPMAGVQYVPSFKCVSGTAYWGRFGRTFVAIKTGLFFPSSLNGCIGRAVQQTQITTTTRDWSFGGQSHTRRCMNAAASERGSDSLPAGPSTPLPRILRASNSQTRTHTRARTQRARVCVCVCEVGGESRRVSGLSTWWSRGSWVRGTTRARARTHTTPLPSPPATGSDSGCRHCMDTCDHTEGGGAGLSRVLGAGGSASGN